MTVFDPPFLVKAFRAAPPRTDAAIGIIEADDQLMGSRLKKASDLRRTLRMAGLNPPDG
jgi:hypothetical protein